MCAGACAAPPNPSVQDDNRFSGPLPASFTFNQSYELIGMTIKDNDFSGEPCACGCWPAHLPACLLAMHTCSTDRSLLQVLSRPGRKHQEQASMLSLAMRASAVP